MRFVSMSSDSHRILIPFHEGGVSARRRGEGGGGVRSDEVAEVHMEQRRRQVLRVEAERT